MTIFLNGLPIMTFELKNQLTKQNVQDAIHQYKSDSEPSELIFNFKRCLVHFAVDDNEVYMCTELKKEKTWFLPFNKGHNDGAGNPPNPIGIKTDYLWKEILTKGELSNILENYAQVVCEEDEETKKKTYKQIFPDFTVSPAKSPREYAMSRNPLFISVLNSPISQPLTSIPRTPHVSHKRT